MEIKVIFFTHHERDYGKLLKAKATQFWDVANRFKETAQYKWVENNDVKLLWHEDDVSIGHGRQYMLYGVLDEKQYTDYALRFAGFENENIG